ncbi:hypothetical protein GW796_10635 [archaeon]|nr:hypothetical protein [archaeon]NCQ52318.1 hypothetical protein [archaeon]
MDYSNIFIFWTTSFGLAFLLSAAAVWNLNGVGLERALVAVSMFFLLFATFTLSKTIRDKADADLIENKSD